jgi:hypothetical protein
VNISQKEGQQDLCVIYHACYYATSAKSHNAKDDQPRRQSRCIWTLIHSNHTNNHYSQKRARHDYRAYDAHYMNTSVSSFFFWNRLIHSKSEDTLASLKGFSFMYEKLLGFQ